MSSKLKMCGRAPIRAGIAEAPAAFSEVCLFQTLEAGAQGVAGAGVGAHSLAPGSGDTTLASAA